MKPAQKVKSSGPDRPFDVLTRTEVAVHVVLEQLKEAVTAKHHTLNAHQIVLLGSIRDGEDMASMTQRSAVALKNVHYAVRALEKLGYLVVEGDDNDRRRGLVKRSAKGRQLVEFATPILAKLIETHLTSVRTQ